MVLNENQPLHYIRNRNCVSDSINYIIYIIYTCKCSHVLKRVSVYFLIKEIAAHTIENIHTNQHYKNTLQSLNKSWKWMVSTLKRFHPHSTLMFLKRRKIYFKANHLKFLELVQKKTTFSKHINFILKIFLNTNLLKVAQIKQRNNVIKADGQSTNYPSDLL